MSVVTAPAVLLRTFAYGDSSRVLRFYSSALGLVGVMARGVRRTGTRSAVPLETFSTGSLTLYVRPSRDLQTLKEFDVVRTHRGLARPVARFAGASVLGDLILRHAGSEGSPSLFAGLGRALDAVEDAPEPEIVPVVLREAWGLVAALGYRPELDGCVHCGGPLDAREMGRFDFAAGGLRCGRCSDGHGGPRVGPMAREQLRRLLAGAPPDSLSRPRAHVLLLGDFITYHVSGGQALPSLRLFHDLADGR